MAGTQKAANRVILWGAVILAVHLPGSTGAQEPSAPDSTTSRLILDLQTAAEADRRLQAVSLLAGRGSPPAIQALRGALSGDPDPTVRAAAAGALGQQGTLARSAIPELMAALEDLTRAGDDPEQTVCASAARALGGMGRPGLGAIGPLTQAGTHGCGGNPSAPAEALARLAANLERIAPLLSSQELTTYLDAFQEAEEALRSAFPTGGRDALTGVRREVRSRKLGWLAPAVSLGIAAGAAVLSLFRRISGVLAALLLTGLVILLLRNSSRVLSPLRILRPVGNPGWRSRFRLARDARVVEAQEARAEPAEKQEGQEPAEAPTKGSQVDVILGDIQERYEYRPGGPSREGVEALLQALAWTLMREGKLEGWVSLSDFHHPGLGPEPEEVLAYLESPMKMAEWDPARGRIRITSDPQLTARLGSLHLLKAERARPQEILTHLGVLHQAASKEKSNRKAADFLRLTASALLDVADALEEEAPDLGVAEEALMALRGAGASRKLPVGERQGLGAGPGDSTGRPAREPDPHAEARLRRLLGRLEAEDHPRVRERIITAMGGMGPEARKALPALMSSVERDPPAVALAALSTLGKMGSEAERAVPLLMGTLEKGRPSHRLAAARALGRMGPAGEEAAPILLSWVSREGVPHELQAGAVEALGGMPGQAEAAIPSLMELLRSPVATEVRAAAALALARLDPGRKEVHEALRQARDVPDPALKGMVVVALLVRDQRVGKASGPSEPVEASRWMVPMAVTAAVLAVLQLGAVIGSEFLSPGTILPALFVGPVMAFLGGIIYAFSTRRLPLNPALGSGVTGWGGASTGLLLGFLVSTALSPLTLVIGGGLALGSGAFGGALVYTALSEG